MAVQFFVLGADDACDVVGGGADVVVDQLKDFVVFINVRRDVLGSPYRYIFLYRCAIVVALFVGADLLGFLAFHRAGFHHIAQSKEGGHADRSFARRSWR